MLQMLYAITGMPKTAITIEAPRTAPSTDSATADATAKSNGDGDNSSEESKEKDKEGGGLYDLKTRKQIQTFLEVRGSVQHHLSHFFIVYLSLLLYGKCLGEQNCSPTQS